jgi:hypothetical protein
VTFSTGFTRYTHSAARGPRFSFGHIARVNRRGELECVSKLRAAYGSAGLQACQRPCGQP